VLVDLNQTADTRLLALPDEAYLLRNALALMKYQHQSADFPLALFKKSFNFTEIPFSWEMKAQTANLLTNYLSMAYTNDRQTMDLLQYFRDVVPLPGSIGEEMFLRGKQEGREEGREQGLEMGRENGLAIDRLASRFEEKVRVLRKLREKGIEAAFAADISGLPLDFVQAFNRLYDPAKADRLPDAAHRARHTADPAAAALEIRNAWLSYGLSNRETDAYFDALGNA
jgi:hypothetical protein